MRRCFTTSGKSPRVGRIQSRHAAVRRALGLHRLHGLVGLAEAERFGVVAQVKDR